MLHYSCLVMVFGSCLGLVNSEESLDAKFSADPHGQVAISKLESMETRFAEKLAKLVESQAEINTRLSELEIKNKGCINANGKHETDEELASLKETMHSKFSALTQNIQQFEQRVETLGMKVNAQSANLAFSTRALENLVYSEDETIVFQHVHLNSGDAYDSDTGVFTCPQDGIYLFTATIRSEASFTPDNNPAVHIMKDREAQVGLYVYPSEGEAVLMSNTVLTTCAPEEEVYVRAIYDIQVNSNHLSSTFSGFYLGL